MRQTMTRTPRLVIAALSLLASIDTMLFELPEQASIRGEQAEKMIARFLWGLMALLACVVIIAQIAIRLGR